MTQGLTAVSSQERISSLDFLRGIAVLGILVINIESFAYPDPWSPYEYSYSSPVDLQVRFWVYFLVQGKLFSMFTMLFGISLCLLTLALLVNYYRYDQWTFKYHQPVTQLWVGVAFAFPKELLGLAYMMLFNGLFQLIMPFSRLRWITHMGRMALSNYLMQSVICGFLFYGYGVGWFNQFSRSELWLIIPCIWILQILISSWVLIKYQQGPVEKLWRKMIY